MPRSKYPSLLRLPDCKLPYPSLLEFLSERFPNIPTEVWQDRISSGKVLDASKDPIDLNFPYQPGAKLYYFREIEAEPPIPFGAEILFQDDDLLVADKPHFLPVTPGGKFVNECLLNRLKDETGNPELTPLHRLDRHTAGVLLLSKRRETREAYFGLFRHGRVSKRYEAWCHVPDELPNERRWDVRNRIEDAEPWFLSRVVPGKPNAHSKIELLDIREGRPSKLEQPQNNLESSILNLESAYGHFGLEPVTGKKHQLRLHLSNLGFPIVNDRFYPELLPEGPDDFTKPLQLLAKSIAFTDPLSAEPRCFETRRKLLGT